MWFDFFTGLIFTTLMIFLPGFLQSKALGLKANFAIATAPLISIFEYVILGIFFDLCNLALSGWIIIGIVLAFSLIAYIVSLRKKPHEVEPITLSWKNLGLYVFIGILITGFHYVQCLNGPDSFAQIYDNAFHLNLIATYIENESFSILNATLSLNQTTDISFYPAAWHVLAALSGSCCNLTAPVAENVINTIFLGLVFPSSCCLFISAIFRKCQNVIPYGSVIILAFCAFPWSFLTYGPLYSNFAGFCLLPLVLSMLMTSFFTSVKKTLTVSLAYFAIGGVVLAACQPNAIFTGLILLLPFFVYHLYLKFTDRGFSQKRALLIVLAIIAFIALLWVLAWVSPFMSGVVNYHWDSFVGIYGAVTNILSLSLKESPNQYLLGLLVIIGVLGLLYFKNQRWLIVSYVLACLIYIVDSTTEDTIRSLFSGFWYNDPYRTAACVTLAATPIATYGLFVICKLLTEILKKVFSNVKETTIRNASKCIAIVVVCIIALEIYSIDTLNTKQDETAFEKIDARLEWLSDPTTQKLTEEEQSFIKKCQAIIGSDEQVINFPYDGSTFAYGADNLNILWRNFNQTASNPDSSYYIIQNSLDKVAYDESVVEAVRNSNADYVLLLDVDYPQSGTLNEDIYDKVKGHWDGVLNIPDAQAGFEVVLAEGDMRLYKIVAEN